MNINILLIFINKLEDIDELMEHVNISMTLNYYAHVTFDSAMVELERLERENNRKNLLLSRNK